MLWVFITSCDSGESIGLDLEDVRAAGITSEVDSSTYNLGILLYNADQGREFWTEFNTQIRPYTEGDTKVSAHRKYFGSNPYLECLAEDGTGTMGTRMATFKTFFDDQTLPDEIARQVTGIRFNALGYDNDSLHCTILGVDGNIIVTSAVTLNKGKFRSYELNFNIEDAKELVFHISTKEGDSARFGLDDVYFKTRDTNPFVPPATDTGFLSWLNRGSFNFFDWNYVQVSPDKGVVLESNTDQDRISLSGLGYAYAIFIVGAEKGFISREEAKNRIRSMLHWQIDQNWFDGSGGWHGFPHHYFRKDGSHAVADVSTIDWAICAAGIRVARQYYANDPMIVEMTDELLARPDWTAALAEEDKIAMGFKGFTGEMNDYRWGLAFSEETELVYLEAVASGDLDQEIYKAIVREKKNGFFPSWFGAGFTYNWLQLWTGPMEPLQSNSVSAFLTDARTSMLAFDRPLMGLTACATVKEESRNGFLNWRRYISNQGGNVHGAGLGEVIQISPAPYGAALALPFTYEEALRALREYVNMGYYHEYLGLPDNVRLKNLPDELKPAPNWDPFDINIGPVILAIEQIENNRIGQLYQADPEIATALHQLIETFPNE